MTGLKPSAEWATGFGDESSMNFLGFAGFIFFILAVGSFFFIQRERRPRELLERKLSELNVQLKLAVERLEEERARRESAFSGMVEGVLLTDGRGDIRHVNTAFREMFQVTGEVEGRSALEVLASVACDDAIQKVIREGQPVEREISFEKPRRRIFQIHFSPMEREGRIFGVVLIFHDLTEIRRLEEIRRDFIANLSHELKTPLTAIQGYAETLLEEAPSKSESSKKYLEIILRHATELNRLMENLLNLSKVESGKEEVLLESIPLRNFVAQLFERFAVQARLKEIELRNEIPEETQIQADPPKLNQILGNLVDNAVKYTPAGGKVWIRVETGSDGCRLEVGDTGVGISPGDQERIFERFYRVDKARSRDSGGAGLGLAIVKHLVELHGGRISVESISNQGSKFHVFLPSFLPIVTNS